MAIGFQVGDPIIGLIITLVILRITWQSFRTIQTDPGQLDEAASDGEPDRRNDRTGPIGSSDHRGHQHESKYTDAATGTSTTDQQGFTGRARGTYEESYD